MGNVYIERNSPGTPYHMRYFILATSLLFLAACSASPEATESTAITSLAAAPLSEAEVIELRTQLDSLLQKLKNPPAEQQYTSNATDVVKKTNGFAKMGALFERGLSSGDSTCRKVCGEIRPLLSEQQQKSFPKWRLDYASKLHAAQDLLRVQIMPRGQEIVLSDPKFSDPQKRAKIKRKFEKPLTSLRYQRVHFWWGKSSREKQSFDTHALADAQISGQASGHR